MIRLAFAAVGLVALTTIGSTQALPDFSGTWRLDPARSDSSAHSETPGPITVAITQAPAEFTIATTTSKGTTNESYKFASPEATVAQGTPLARWRGDTLVTDAIRDVRGQSVTVQQSRRLANGGQEMIVESVVNVQHGYTAAGAKVYGASKDVFIRVQH